MRNALIPAVLLLAVSATDTRADSIDPRDWYSKVQSLARSLLQPHRSNREVITPPQDMDSKMALVPPAAGPRMPVIAPRSER